MLLDTHALVWALLRAEQLSAAVHDALARDGQRWVSAASIYEMVYKARRGKWGEVEELLDFDLGARLAAAGFAVLPATAAVMETAAGLDWVHRDPFDRIIVATALIEGMPVISKDETLDGNGAAGWRRIW